MDWTEDAARFGDSLLAPYSAVVFLSTTGDVLDSAQQLAFERYIAGGKGYVGIHAAADTEYEWPFYRALVGRQFVQHPHHQDGTIHVEATDFPGMAGFGDSLRLYEEWYEYTEPYADDLTYLYRIDTNSYEQRGWKGPSKMGAFHPLGWYHEYGGGRAFYTGLGHMDATFELPAFREHLAAGLHWAMTGALEAPNERVALGLRKAVYEVGDLAAAKTWYANAFAVAPSIDEPTYVGFDLGGHELGLRLAPRQTLGTTKSKRPQASAKTTNVRSYWRVRDIKKIYKALLAAGASPDVAPERDREGTVTASVVDPWGNVVGLISDLDGK